MKYIFFILLCSFNSFAEKIDLQDQEWLYETRRGDTIEAIIGKTAGPHLKESEVGEYIRKVKNANLQITDWKKLKPGNEIDLHELKSTYKEVIHVESREMPDFYLPSYRVEAFYTVASSTLKESFDDFSVQGDKISVKNFGLKASYGTSHNPVHWRFSGTYMDLYFDEYKIRDYHVTAMDFNHFENLNFYYTYRHRLLDFTSLDFDQNPRSKNNKLHFLGSGAQFYFYLLDRKVQFDTSANILFYADNAEKEKENFGSIIDFTVTYSPVKYLEGAGFIDFLYLNGGGRIHRTLLVGFNFKIFVEI